MSTQLHNASNGANTVEFAVDEIRAAWRQSRPIVPIIGAGLSAESGVPPLSPIIRYIGQLASLVNHSNLMPPNPKKNAALKCMTECFRSIYGADLAKYIKEQGWPSFNSIDAELNRRFPIIGGTASPTNLAWLSLGDLVREIHPRTSHILELRLRQLGSSRSSADELTEVIGEILVDWRVLIQHVTAYHKELADGLFKIAHQDKVPGTYLHVFAMLVRLLNIETIFTFNFDQLVEEAFRAELLRPSVFGMENGRSLPPRSLVSEPCIIKMHGSTHNLLIDTTLDHPLSKEYTDRFLELAGTDPLFVVFGCSGNDRRLRDLLHAVYHRYSGSGSRTNVLGQRVLWFSHSMDPTLDNIHVDFSKTLQPYEVRSPIPAFLLFEIYQQLTKRLPRVRSGYRINFAKPLTRKSLTSRTLGDAEIVSLPNGHVFSAAPQPFPQRVLIDCRSEAPPNLQHRKLPSCISLLKLCTRFPISHHVIYVDLEQHYSAGSVLEEFLAKAKTVDSNAVPSLLPVSKTSSISDASLTVEDASRSILRTLSRGRFILVFDGIETFNWRTTTHHGTTSWHSNQTSVHKERTDRDALLEIVREVFGAPRERNESIVIVVADTPVTRHDGNEEELLAAEEAKKNLDGFLRRLSGHETYTAIGIAATDKCVRQRLQIFTSLAMASDKSKEAFDENAQFLQLFCTVRRTRPLPFVRFLHRCAYRKSDQSDASFAMLIDSLEKQGMVFRLDGGFVAIDRSTRNAVYDAVTSGASAGDICRHLVGLHQLNEVLTKSQKSRDKAQTYASVSVLELVETCKTCMNAAMLHSHCAHWYFHYAYTIAHDAHAFLEYVYHRVSCLRYLTDLLLVLSALPDELTLSLESLWQYLSRQLDRARRFDSRLFVLDEQSNMFSAVSDIFGTDEDLRVDDNDIHSHFKKCVDELKKQRNRYLTGVIERWKAADVFLRGALIPQTVLSWTETLLQYDAEQNLFFRKRLNRLVGPKIQDGDMIRSRMEELLSEEMDSELILESEFRWAVLRTEYRCRYESGDFLCLAESSLRSAVENLMAIAGRSPVEHDQLSDASLSAKIVTHVENISNELKLYNDHVDEDAQFGGQDQPVLGRIVHSMLDAIISIYWGAFSSGPGNHSTPSEWHKLMESCKTARTLSADLISATVARFKDRPHWLIEATLRQKYGEVEEHIGKHSSVSIELEYFHRDPRVAQSSQSSNALAGTSSVIGQAQNDLKLCRIKIGEGKNELSHEVIGQTRGVFNPFLNGVDEGALFLPYRSFFGILHGRFFGATGFLLACVQRMSNATSDLRDANAADNAFRQAYAEFDGARGGIDDNNRAMLTLCDFFAAEVAFMHSRAVRMSESRSIDVIICKSEQSKLRSCEAYIKAAFEGLCQGGRHVMLWRGVFVLWSRCVAQLMWVNVRNCIEAKEKDEVVQRCEIGRAIRELRQAIERVRQALDVCPSGSERFVTLAFHAWNILMAAGVAIHWLVLREIRRGGQLSDSDFHRATALRNTADASVEDRLEEEAECFYACWLDVCDSAGLSIGDLRFWQSCAHQMYTAILRIEAAEGASDLSIIGEFRCLVERGQFAKQQELTNPDAAIELWRRQKM